MKHSEIQNEFENFAKIQGIKVGIPSHFEGGKYILHKQGTVSLKYADARCGRRLAIILHLKNGCISQLTSYLPIKELYQLLIGAQMNYKKEVLRHKKMYN